MGGSFQVKTEHAGQEEGNDESQPSHNVSPPHIPDLPAEVWTRILEYTPLSDSLKLASYSTFIRDSALSQLRFLYIDSKVSWSNDLFPFSTFFSSVQQVVMDNLLRNVSNNGTFDLFPRKENDMQCLVLFLSSCPSLQHVWIGNGENERKQDIMDRLSGQYESPPFAYVRHPRSPKCMEVATTYEFLLNELTNGYRHGSVSENVVIHGLPPYHDNRGSFTRECRTDGCRLCRNVCLYFPLSQVTSFKRIAGGYLPRTLGSVSVDTKMAWILERQGGREILIEKYVDVFHDLAERYIIRHLVDDAQATHSVITYDTSVLNAMIELRDCGCDISLVPIGRMSQFCQRYKIQRGMYAKLCEIGFQVTEDDFLSILTMSRRTRLIQLNPNAPVWRPTR